MTEMSIMKKNQMYTFIFSRLTSFDWTVSTGINCLTFSRVRAFHGCQPGSRNKLKTQDTIRAVPTLSVLIKDCKLLLSETFR